MEGKKAQKSLIYMVFDSLIEKKERKMKEKEDIEISGPVMSGLALLVLLVFVAIGINLYKQKIHAATIQTVTSVAPVEVKKVLTPVAYTKTHGYKLRKEKIEKEDTEEAEKGVEKGGVVEFRGVKTQLKFE